MSLLKKENRPENIRIGSLFDPVRVGNITLKTAQGR